MIRIGEVAKMHNISNRTLRHWEQNGILASKRAENGYRYYDEENTARIQHIVLLRKLKMPIGDIERIFAANNPKTALEILTSHLEKLRQKTAVYATLSHIVESIIGRIHQSQNLTQMLQHLAAADTVYEDIPKINLSERIITMENLKNVRIVELPAMTFATHNVISETPEMDCSAIFDPFILEHKLHTRAGHRSFGFNNPEPCQSSPRYGYELWTTIPDDFVVPAPFVKKSFAGGLFASVSANMNEIGERWEALYNWSTQSEKYENDFARQWLEEMVMNYEDFISPNIPAGEKQLDLLLPIKPR
ncbi:MAG: MerR family transcriptional regulator [Defluviitaleaceae bacterium]|nr:MerR family transcriptional regulator [Defluviitaleaceae bacterium]